MSFPASSLRLKFLLVFLVSALVPMGLFALVTQVRTSDGLNDIENRLVDTTARNVESGVAQQQSARITPFTVSEDFIHAVDRGDRQAVEEAAWRILTDRNLMQVDVRGADGTLLACASILPSAQRITVGRTGYAFQSYLGTLWVICDVPVTTGGQQVGAVTVAGQVDDALLHDVAQLTATPASMYVDGNLVASSRLGASQAPDRLPAASGRSTSGTWLTSLSQLRDAQGRSVAVLSVAIPDSAFDDMRSSVQTTAALALALALVTALLAALVLARQMARPLRTLSTAAEAMIEGEMRQHIQVTGKDEVATVGRAFNRMSERVTETVNELSDQIQSLSRDLADLSLVGETLARSPDVKMELMSLAEHLREMTRSDFCGIHLLDDERLPDGIYAGAVNGSMLAVEELVRWTTEAGEVATVSGLAQDERLSPLAARAATGISEVMVIPVVHQMRVIGAISVGRVDRQEYPQTTAALLSTVASQVATALRHAETFKELEASYLQTVVALAAALEAKDEYTASHAETIASMALAVGQELGLSEAELRRVEYVALLHDIGKLGISAAILDKPGPLSPEERATVQTHTLIGERIVARIDYLRPLGPLVRAAHECWDGTGYPDRAAGEAIPLESRIAFVCDAFHAMTSERTYRPRLDEAAALEELQSKAGSQFDPAVVAAFLEVWARGQSSERSREAASHIRRSTSAGGAARVG